MGVWGWIVLYVLLFSLLQLFLYRYLRSDDGAALFRSTPPSTDLPAVEDAAEFDDRSRSRSGDASGVVCPQCGTENEPDYTYCWNCVNQITAR